MGQPINSEVVMPRVQPGPPCQICSKPSIARNLCRTHYMRWKRHGHTEQTRPADWGSRENHPMYQSWTWMNRDGGRIEEWNDFWAFVNDVGKRPSENHVLRRYDTNSPFGPDNFFWQETRDCGDRAKRMREYRKENPVRFKRYDLKRRGTTLEAFDKMLSEQDGKCAICGQEETLKIYGKTVSLAIDHCHTSGRFRGLLCKDCNTGLGSFKDDPSRLQKAIDYLKKGESNT